MGRKRHVSRTPAIPAGEFELVREFVERVHAAVEAAGISYAEGDIYRAVGRLAHWCRVRGIALDPTVVLNDATISEWMLSGLDELAVGTRRNYVVIARTAGRVLADPRTLPVAVPSVPTPRSEWPYTLAEIGTLTRWASGRRTAYARHNAVAMVGLGLGAGLRSTEFLNVRGRDITVDDAGVTVTVTGGRHPRTVPVLAEWESKVAKLVTEVDPGSFVFRPDRTVSRPNSVSVFLRDADPPECGVSMNRARITWIVGILNVGVPLAAFLQAAGITSVTSLERYQPWLIPPSMGDARAALRGKKSQGSARWVKNLDHVEGDKTAATSHAGELSVEADGSAQVHLQGV